MSFFPRGNPGHARGDELACLCELDESNLTRAGRVAAAGDLYVEAQGPDGKPIWRYVFPDSSGCGQYSDRPHFFMAGRFTGATHLDVFTYSTKPQARAYVLDGRTGQPVFKQEQVAGIERHFQAFGGRAGACDFNGDGADDVIFLNPDQRGLARRPTRSRRAAAALPGRHRRAPLADAAGHRRERDGQWRRGRRR